MSTAIAGLRRDIPLHMLDQHRMNRIVRERRAAKKIREAEPPEMT